MRFCISCGFEVTPLVSQIPGQGWYRCDRCMLRWMVYVLHAGDTPRFLSSHHPFEEEIPKGENAK
jgi:DNA-directed RNA polymerase subunit RPC12/RpoP